jgi:hypothetical protein
MRLTPFAAGAARRGPPEQTRLPLTNAAISELPQWVESGRLQHPSKPHCPHSPIC